MKVYLNFINNKIVLACTDIGRSAVISFKGCTPTQFTLLGMELYKTYYLRSADRSDVTVAKYKIHAMTSVRKYIDEVINELKKMEISVRANAVSIHFNDPYAAYFRSLHEMDRINKLYLEDNKVYDYVYPLTK